MNERIESIAIETLNYLRHNVLSRSDMEDIQVPDVFIEKFAQLIAKECAQLAMTQHCSTSPADYGDMEPYQQGCDDTASTISGMIRRTFGVEE